MNNKRNIFTRDDKEFEKKLKNISARFKGIGGGPESESAVVACKIDIKDGFVWFWADNSDITNLISRSKKYILEVNDCNETIGIKMDKKGFRGCTYCFKVDSTAEGGEDG